MKISRFVIIGLIISFIAIMACDEGMQVTKPVITPPTEPTTNGEVKQPEPTEPVEPVVEKPPTEADFVGWVYTPEVQFVTLDNGNRHAYTGRHRDACAPVQGVTVTIVGSGKKATTNKDGRYILRNVKEDSLRLRTQKNGFETKEVLVHRSGPTALISDGNVVEINYERGIQKNPGTILIGHRWPDEIRFIFKQTVVMPDLLYIRHPLENPIAFYIKGVVVVDGDIEEGDFVAHYTAHEIAHAHQEAIRDVDEMGAVLGSWDKTPEGKAFIEARKKDWDTVGKIAYDSFPHYTYTIENAAETCAHYWSIGRWEKVFGYDLEKEAPNRFKWVEEWVALDGNAKQPEPTEPVEPGEEFIGQVLIPSAEYPFRGNAQAVAEIKLTVMSGPQSGKQSKTNKNGYYSFANITGDTLHLRTEKEGFEPKEVIVHRSNPTTLADGSSYFDISDADDPQQNPGVILVGHRWPDKVRFILEETKLPPDLLLVLVKDIPPDENIKIIRGLYGSGVVVIKEGNCLSHTIAHELAHAHQHAVAVADQGPLAGVLDWENTPSGKAYVEAREKDWDEVGKASYDSGHYFVIYENMAETARYFWNIRGKFDTRLCSIIKKDIPNRLKWAEEWLGKKYK